MSALSMLSQLFLQFEELKAYVQDRISAKYLNFPLEKQENVL